MDLKELLGEAYKEDMTFEEIQAALAGKELIDPSTLPKTVRKEQFDKLASELAETKKLLKEVENTNLSEEQRIAQELAAQEETIVNLRKEVMRASGKQKLAKAGIENHDLVDRMLDSFNVTDRDAFEKLVDDITVSIKSVESATEKAVVARLTSEMPTPPEPKPGGVRTLSDLNMTEQMKLKVENREEYDKLLALSEATK